VHVGGICPTNDNHFGGPAGVSSQLNLMIQQRPGELASCIEFFLKKQISGEKLDYYAEIGACAGGTTRSMYNFLKFKELLIIDDNGAEWPAFYINDRKNLNRPQNLKDIPLFEIIGSSAEQRVIDEALKKSETQKYDILFIDGAHTYDGVKNDTINYLPIVRQGGYLIFHDTAHITEITQWVAEIPDALPNLTKVGEFHQADQYTPAFPNGIGLTVFQKN
jgi:hypothetical protein